MAMFWKSECTVAAGRQQEPYDSPNDGIMGVSLFSVIPHAVCKFCVLGSIFVSQTWAAAAVIKTANKQKEERMTVILMRYFVLIFLWCNRIYNQRERRIRLIRSSQGI